MEKSHMWQILILLLNVNNEPKHGEKNIYIYFFLNVIFKHIHRVVIGIITTVSDCI